MVQVGDTYKAEITVEEKDTAIVHKSGGLPVYATPAMVALMENSAYSLLKANGSESVGTQMNVNHSRACLTGSNVYAQATVTGINGNWVTFEVAAFDEKGEIGNGQHTRYIIDPQKFMNKLNK